MRHLHIDIETYSPTDLKKSGVYKYAEDVNFRILIICFALDGGEVFTVDMLDHPSNPNDPNYIYFIQLIRERDVKFCAHNAQFERICFKNWFVEGSDVYKAISSPTRWLCTANLSAQFGYPLSLAGASEALQLADKAKLSTGKELIKYFCVPCKPTKVNGGRVRNLPDHAPDKWEEFKKYCVRDVEAERAIHEKLGKFKDSDSEDLVYIADQIINDRGIKLDSYFVSAAKKGAEESKETILAELKSFAGIENPNSPAQLCDWLSKQLGETVESVSKGAIDDLLSDPATPDHVRKVLRLRLASGKSSVKKYDAMLNAECSDGRLRGLVRYYGASRTGRWAGRLVQVQNLPRNYIDDLDGARDLALQGYDCLSMLYSDTLDTYSQLIRTSLVAPVGKKLVVADYSAIEARVLAWLAGETWRLDVFNTHGKIYEASAANMFSVPIEQVTKGSDLRSKGKIAELALGYGGSVGALSQMGGEKMGLTQGQMKGLVESWRNANRNITKFWREVERLALKAVASGGEQGFIMRCGEKFRFHFGCIDGSLSVMLPSGRPLYYQDARVCEGKFGQRAIKYKSIDQTTGKWGWVETYGGKLTENIVQAVARDLMAYSLVRLESRGEATVMHVHDEVVCECDHDDKFALDRIISILVEKPRWAEDLPLDADGFESKYYKKD